MEAVGAAATIVQLISFTGSVLASGYSYLAKVKRAPSEIRSLLRETASLQALLNELHALVNDLDDSFDENVNGALDTLHRLGVFEDCQLLIKVVERSLKACQQIDGELARNVGKKVIWPFREKETKDAITQLGRLRESLSTAVVVDSANTLKYLEATTEKIDKNVIGTLEVVMQIQVSVDGTAAKVAQLDVQSTARAQTARNSAVRRWLYPDGTDSEAGLGLLVSERQPGTGTWLLESDDFRTWKNEVNGWMWLHGTAGCGKSVMAGTIIKHLQSSAAPLARNIIYFFCDRRIPGRQSFQDLLHVIIKQLVERDVKCFKAAAQAYDELKSSQKDPDSPLIPLTSFQYIKLIQELLGNWPSTNLVVDALDEANEASNFIEGLSSITRGVSNLKILVTSRYEAELVRSLEPIVKYQISLVDHMQNDIEMYLMTEIERRVASGAIKFREPGLDIEIFNAIKHRTDGMILIAKLQLEYISGLKNDRAIKAALKTLPSGVYYTYDEILYQLCSRNPEEVEDIRKILMWLVGSQVPLCLKEVAEAISIRPDDHQLDESGIATDILDVAALCGSLVTLRTQDPKAGSYEDLRGEKIMIIALSHASVEDYLTSGKVGQGIPEDKGVMLHRIFHMELPVIHKELARVCLQYIGFDEFEIPLESPTTILDYRGSLQRPDIWDNRRRLRQRTAAFALYDYSCRYWCQHLLLSNCSLEDDRDMLRLLKWFIHDWQQNKHYLSWQQMYHRDIIFCCLNRPSLYYAIEFKIPDLISYLLPPKGEVDILRNGTSALHVAARCGALEAVRILIDRGASIHLESSMEARAMTALHFAAEGGHARVAKLLIASGASIHATATSGATPLYRAARSGSLKTLKVLYKAGGDLNALTWDHFTPLFEAVAHRRRNIAAQLLQWGADPTIPNDGGQTAVGFICEAKNSTAQKIHAASHMSNGDFSLVVAEQRLDQKSPPSSPPFLSKYQARAQARRRHRENPKMMFKTMNQIYQNWPVDLQRRQPSEKERSPSPSPSRPGPMVTEDQVLAEIVAMRTRGADISEYRTFVSDLTTRWVYFGDLWMDTRPGTEREKESRWTQNFDLIGTLAEFHDKEESDGDSDMDWH